MSQRYNVRFDKFTVLGQGFYQNMTADLDKGAVHNIIS